MATAAPVKPVEGNGSRIMTLSLGAGSGFALATAVLELMKPDAKPITEAVVHWGPLFVIVLVAMWLLYGTFNSWGQKLVDAAMANVAAQTANAAALRSMGDAMQRISQRDDERDRERELAMDHLAYTAQSILSKVEAIEQRCLASSCVHSEVMRENGD